MLRILEEKEKEKEKQEKVEAKKKSTSNNEKERPKRKEREAKAGISSREGKAQASEREVQARKKEELRKVSLKKAKADTNSEEKIGQYKVASPWCSVIKRKGCSDRGCQIMGMIQSTCSGCRYFTQLKQRNLLPIHLLIAVLLCSPEVLHQCLSVQHKRLVILKVELVFTNIPLVHLAILVQYCIMVMRCLVWEGSAHP